MPPRSSRALTSPLLGGVVRARRLAAGVTLARLAELTGLSQSFLSQLENGRTNASLGSLQVIADALSTTATVLLADADADVEPVVRSDDAALTQSADSTALVRALVRGKRQLKALEFTGDAHSDREFVHENDELMYVVDGAIEVTLRAQGTEVTHSLGRGDAVYVEAKVTHSWRATEPDTRVILVSVADDMVVRRSTRPTAR